MALAVPATFGQTHESNVTAADRNGATVTASGTAHVKGSWASCIDPTSRPSYGVTVIVTGIGVAATRSSFLIDIGIGPTGGGSEQVVIPNLDCWGACASGSNAHGAKSWYFPLYIPAGVRVSARGQASVVSDVANVAIVLHQQPLFEYRVSRWMEHGAVTSTSNGTSVTPGSGSFGSWTQIGSSTARAHHLWTCGYDLLADTTALTAELVVEIGYGPNSGAVRSLGIFVFAQGAGEMVSGPYPAVPIYRPVPSGSNLWARIASAEAEARGVIIYAGD